MPIAPVCLLRNGRLTRVWLSSVKKDLTTLSPLSIISPVREAGLRGRSDPKLEVGEESRISDRRDEPHSEGKETMTKADIASIVAERGLAKKQAMQAVEVTFDIVKNALMKGERIQLVGFGSFEVKAKRARKGRNPQTGEPITISARKVLKFKPGKALHQAVNDLRE